MIHIQSMYPISVQQDGQSNVKEKWGGLYESHCWRLEIPVIIPLFVTMTFLKGKTLLQTD